MDEVLREESLGIIEGLRKAEKAREQAEKEAQEVEKERKRLEEAKRESDKELERLRHEQELQRQMTLEEEKRKLEQQLQTKELKRQAAEKEKQKQSEKEIKQTQIKVDHIDREFRERLSSADSIQYYSGTAGQLTEQEMLDLLITRNKLEARLRKMDKTHKALEEASLDLDPSTKIRHKRVRERVVEDLQRVEHYLQSMREIIMISSDEEEEKEIVKGEPLKGQEEQPSQAQKEMEANLISVLEEADTSEKIEGQPGGLTDRQLKGALIRRQYLRNKLLQVDSALAACRAVGNGCGIKSS